MAGNEKAIRTETVGADMLAYSLYGRETEDGLSYSVEVKSSLFGEERTSRQDDVTTVRELAEELFEMLVRNMVLPSTLKDVTEDFVTEIYSLKH